MLPSKPLAVLVYSQVLEVFGDVVGRWGEVGGCLGWIWEVVLP